MRLIIKFFYTFDDYEVYLERKRITKDDFYQCSEECHCDSVDDILALTTMARIDNFDMMSIKDINSTKYYFWDSGWNDVTDYVEVD